MDVKLSPIYIVRLSPSSDTYTSSSLYIFYRNLIRNMLTLFCIALILIVSQVSAFSAARTFGKNQVSSIRMAFDWGNFFLPKSKKTSTSTPVVKNTAVPSKASTSSAKKATVKKGAKDMTWGGR